MHRHRCAIFAFFIVTMFFASAACALIMVSRGNNPVSDGGWPAGALEVANQKSRVALWEGPPFGGGQTCFLYRGDLAALDAAIKAFAGIRAPALKLVVHEGPQNSPFLKDSNDPRADTHYDWSFTVWNPASWHRLYNDPRRTFGAISSNFRKPVDPPQLDVYITAKFDWKKITVPEGITVVDERPVEGTKAGSGAVLRGDVFDMATGKPIAGAEVRIERQGKTPNAWEKVASGVADGIGRFEVAKIPAGTARIVAGAKGYAPRELGYEEIRDGTVMKRTVELSGITRLAGTIVDESGKPIANVKVRATNILGIDGRGYGEADAQEATSDEKGAFILGSLPRGYCQLWAVKEGWYQLDPFKLHEMPEMRPGLTIQMVQTGGIKGKVVAANGKPTTGGTINVWPPGDPVGKWGGSMNLAADGSFEFKNVPPGPYTVSTRPDLPGVKPDPNAQQITVVSGKTVEVVVKQ